MNPRRTLLVPADDGTTLAGDYCLPDGPGPFACVLIRTPYGRRSHAEELRAWARRGLAAMAQDVRGRHGSAGHWHPYLNEADDGAATVRALQRQPWSNGVIIASGASYAAHCALAIGLHPDPRTRPGAIIAAVPALGLAETARERSGVERVLARAGWWAAHGDRADSDPSALERALAADPGLLDRLPLLDLPKRLGRPLASWERLWAARRSGDPAGTLDTLTGPPGETGPCAESGAVPLLAVGGSYDPFVSDTLALWQAWGRQGSGAARLLVGPWGHALTACPGPGASTGHRVVLGPLYARFVRAALNGTLSGQRGAVALAGTNHWLDARQPAPPPRPVPLDGTPTGLRVIRGTEFVADPHHPVRSDTFDAPSYGRPDRLLALGGPLPGTLDLAGDAEARILAQADALSADWVVRLVALTADDAAEHLATGIARSQALPGTFTHIRVPLGPLFRRLCTGTRLRLEIAGHHYPAHARNPHTGHDPIRATVLYSSRRIVVPDGCRLLLPVLDPTTTIRPVAPHEEIAR